MAVVHERRCGMKPLDGVRIVALEQFVAGPLATMWLADAGAEVIKVEAPGQGDTARTVEPRRQRDDGSWQSLSFLRMNRNKKSIALDLKTAEGRSLFLELLRTADAMCTNLGPDTLRRLELDHESVRQAVGDRLIYASVSGFGHEDVLPGPLSGLPSFDIVAQAMAGLMGRPEGAAGGPVYTGFPLADIFAGANAATGILLALIAQREGGRGGHVDVSMYDGGIVLNELALIMSGATGAAPTPGGHGMACPFGVYRARDGHIAIGIIGEGLWRRLCLAIDRPDLLEREDLSSGYARTLAAAEVNAIVDGWLASRTAAEAAQIFAAHSIPSGVVQDERAVLESDQAHARRMFLDVRDEAWGSVRVVANPIKTPWTGLDSEAVVPSLGQHTGEVLRALGINAEATDALRERRIVD